MTKDKSVDRVAVVILARGGSKGIPGKNLALVGGEPLVARSVKAGRAAQRVTVGVWVSTDDATIAQAARQAGAKIIKRPDDLSDDCATSEAGWLHALHAIRSRCGEVDRLVFLQCTSPFTTGAEIDACLAAQDAQGAACAVSVLPDHGFRWQQGADGFAQGLGAAAMAPRPRRQDLEPQYLESGAIYTVDAAAFEAVGHRFCGSVALCVLDHPPIEIDSPRDLAWLQAIAQAQGFGTAFATAAE